MLECELPTQGSQCASGCRWQTEIKATAVRTFPRIGSLDLRMLPWAVRYSLCKNSTNLLLINYYMAIRAPMKNQSEK